MLVVAVLVGVAAALAAVAVPHYYERTKRAEVSDGLVLAGMLQTHIAGAFERAPTDMSCTPERCLVAPRSLTSKYVRSVTSARTGAVLIVYSEEVFPASANKLTLAPLIDGRVADLSDPANAGKKVGGWRCGRDALTTVKPKYLPSVCK